MNIQQYGHDYYGQSNYIQELEFDRQKMSYNSNLEMDEFSQQYGHDDFIEDNQYDQSNYVQEFEFDSHEMSL